MTICRQETPRMRRLSDSHRVCCHLYNDREEWIVQPPAFPKEVRPQPQDKGGST
jgi:hypothetical protein